MVFPFARHVSERGPRIPGRVPVQKVELKTERFAMAYRFLLDYAFVRPRSDQNSSHLQIDFDWGSLAIRLVSRQSERANPGIEPTVLSLPRRRNRQGNMEAPGDIHTGASFMPTRVGGRARDIDDELDMRLRETRQHQ